MKRPRILLVSGHGPPFPDGIADYGVRLLTALKAQPFEADWAWLCRRIRWFDSPVASHEGLRLWRPNRSWGRLGTAAAEAFLRWYSPDLIHIADEIYSFHLTDAAVRLADAAPCPVVVTAGEFHAELPAVRHTMELLKRADVLLTNDRQTSERCRKLGGRAPDHQGWVSSGVLPLPGPDAARVPGLCSTFGIINEGRRLPVLHEALKRLRARRKDLRWEIIGLFDPIRQPYHAELARRFSEPWITFAGYADPARLRRLLARSELMLLPFLDGATLGRTTLATAWLFGLPVVTNAAGIAEPAVEDGVNCLLADPEDPGAWAAAAARLLDDRALAQRLISGGRETARQFSWERLAALHASVYQRLLGAEP